jgi:hypothetical protein
VHSHRLRASGFVWKPGGRDADGRWPTRAKLGPARRNDAASQHRRTRSHDRHRAVAIDAQYCAGRGIRRSGSWLAVGVVAAEHGIPTARWYRVAGWRPLAKPARR